MLLRVCYMGKFKFLFYCDVFWLKISAGVALSSTSPIKSSGKMWSLRLEQSEANQEDEIGLVSKSASWSLPYMKATRRDLFCSLFLTKWKSISMCFLLAWNTGLEGLENKYMAHILSQYSRGEQFKLTQRSRQRDVGAKWLRQWHLQ